MINLKIYFCKLKLMENFVNLPKDPDFKLNSLKTDMDYYSEEDLDIITDSLSISSIGSSASASPESSYQSNNEDFNNDVINIKNYQNLDGFLYKSIQNKSFSKGIREELKNYNFPDDISELANSIYSDSTNCTTRGNQRKLIIFRCIEEAYRQKNIAKPPISIAEQMGTNYKELIKKRGRRARGYKMIQTSNAHYTPIDFIKEFSNFMELNDRDIEEIKVLTKEITEKNSDILERYPQVVAGAIIIYYINYKGYIEAIPLSEFSKKIGYCKATLVKTSKEIADIHNS